jgi:hypothetical protein
VTLKSTLLPKWLIKRDNSSLGAEKFARSFGAAFSSFPDAHNAQEVRVSFLGRGLIHLGVNRQKLPCCISILAAQKWGELLLLMNLSG